MRTQLNWRARAGGAVGIGTRRRLLALARDAKATHLYTVTPMIGAFAALPDLEQLRAPSLKFISCGASSLDVEVGCLVSARLQVPVVQGYGLTEASPLTHAGPVIAGYVSPPGTSGIPVPDTEQRIVDMDSGDEVQQGQVGQLCLRGPQVMKGYWKDQGETDRALRDGWLHTGDLAWVDREGYLHYVDRSKDVIKREGHTIAPAELESVLREHEAVADCAVVAKTIEHDEQVPYAYVVQRTTESAAEILRAVNERLAAYKRIEVIEFVDKIPRTKAGKVLRRVLRELAVRGEANGAAKPISTHTERAIAADGE